MKTMIYKTIQIGRLGLCFCTTHELTIGFGIRLHSIFLTVLCFTFSVAILPKGLKL